MQKSFIFISIIILFFACAEDEPVVHTGEEAASFIIGRWQVVEYFYSIGTSVQQSNLVENGSILHLKSDGKFETNLVKDQTGGNFEIKGDSLLLSFRRPIKRIENVYRFKIEDESLYLFPLSPIICIEGCSQRLEKLDE